MNKMTFNTKRSKEEEEGYHVKENSIFFFKKTLKFEISNDKKYLFVKTVTGNF